MIGIMKRAMLALAPLFFIASFWVFVMANQANFPDPMAIHWGLGGEPDGFGSLEEKFGISVLVLLLIGGLWAALVYLGRIPRSVRLLFLAITGLIWLVLFVLFNYTFVIQLGLQDASEARLGVVFFVSLTLVPLLMVPWLLSKPVIDIGQRLSVSYWRVPLLRVDYQNIESARESEARLRDFGGLGIRYANKTTAFMPSAGPAVELVLKTGEKVLIRTDQPRELVGEIEQRRNGN